LGQGIREEALRLGFTAAGIASAAALHNRRHEMAEWLQRGFAGPLGYMQQFFSRQQRFLDSFPEARSILVLASDYGAFTQPAPDPALPAGRIARYALSRDYHKVLRRRLKKLETWIRHETGKEVRFRKTVDTSPVQERALAEAAGLGFFGKNTCLIRPKGGSFFFLCTLITDLEMDPEDPPGKNWNCGSCTLCIEACPTGALAEPYRLDASLCISSLTIEHRGTVPPELRPALGDWIFGCDICQEVCPYNRTKSPPPAEDFPSALTETMPLSDILQCRTQGQFEALFSGTPLTRPGREGLVRNAAIAAGNLRETRLLPELAECLLNDSSPLVRSHAAWALEQIGGPEAARILQQAGLQTTP